MDEKMEDSLQIQDRSLLEEMEDYLNETNLSTAPFTNQDFRSSTPIEEETTKPREKFVMKPIVWTTQMPENPLGKPSDPVQTKTQKTKEEKEKERDKLNHILQRKQSELDR